MPSLKLLITLHFLKQEAVVQDDGIVVHMFSRQILGKVDFEKSFYDEESKMLTLLFQPMKPMNFITIHTSV